MVAGLKFCGKAEENPKASILLIHLFSVWLMARIFQDINSAFNRSDATLRLIMLNLGIFILIHLIQVPLFLFGISGPHSSFTRDWLFMPAQLSEWITRPWTIFTYMFLHAGIWHIVWNMLMLYWFGRILGDFIAPRRLVGLYLLGGLLGAVFFVLAYNVFPVLAEGLNQATLVGASAGVMAIVVGSAVIAPHLRLRLLFLGEIPLQYLVLVLVILDLIMIPASNPGGHFAHLGGAVMGWIYIQQLRQGRDLARPFYAIQRLFNRLMNRNQSKPSTSPRKQQPRTVPLQRQAQRFDAEQLPLESPLYSKNFMLQYRHMTEEECMNAILDKISASGVSSLSPDEKKFLELQSKLNK